MNYMAWKTDHDLIATVIAEQALDQNGFASLWCVDTVSH